MTGNELLDYLLSLTPEQRKLNVGWSDEETILDAATPTITEARFDRTDYPWLDIPGARLGEDEDEVLVEYIVIRPA